MCDALHFVCDADPEYGFIPSQGNPTGKVCGCKGARAFGLCSHILTVNHLLLAFNVRYQLLPIGKKGDQKMGRKSKPKPALTREPRRDPDSSDEEVARALALGEQAL